MRDANRTAPAIGRRGFLGAAAAAMVFPVLAARAVAAQAKPTLIYLSAWDCPVCRQWERGFYPSFEKGALAHTVTFRQVAVHHLFDLREKEMWPSDLDWLRVQVPKSEAPRFFLIEGRKIVVRGDGIDGWTDVIEPRLRKLARAGS